MASFDRDKVIPAPDVGPGWTMLEVQRKAGKSAKQYDRYWFSPAKHHRFRSKPEIGRYKLALEAAPGNDEDAAWKIFKGRGAAAGGGKAKAKAKGSPAKKRKSSGATSSATSSSSSAKKKKKKKREKYGEVIGAKVMDISGPDAGAGAGRPFPSTASTTTTTTTAAKSSAVSTKPLKHVTSRKARGTGRAGTRGYIPNVDPSSHKSDGPYVDEDEITRIYNFPKGASPTEGAPEIAYDGDKDLEGIDEGGTPYRHITSWFLAKPGGVHRMALPAQARFVKTESVCLYGELLPSPRRVMKAIDKGKEPPSNQPVVIRRGLLWSIDRDHVDRGIWFGTKDAWYKLEQPCTAKIYNGKSQEDLHVKLRAKFDLVSNLLDMFTESSKALNLESFFGLHACRSPAESHTLLTPTMELLEEYPQLVAEPFDLELLKREAKFVNEHLAGCHEDFSRTCNFVKGLAAMEKAWKASGGAAAEDNFDYLASAKAAEDRAGRFPWGCLKSHRESTKPKINLLVEVKVERSRSPQKPQKIKNQLTPREEERPQKNEVKVAAAVARSQAVSSAKKKEVRVVSAKAAAPVPTVKISSKARSSPRGSPRESSSKVGASKAIRKSPSFSDDSMFQSDSDDEDEWKPSGAASKTTESLIESSEEAVKFRVLDTKLYPILIDEVKRDCSVKLKPFLDSAAHVLHPRAGAFIRSFVMADTVPSYEYMLVVVECLRVSSVPVLQRLFDEKNPETAACRRIFVSWLDAARGRMAARRTSSVEKCILEAVKESSKTEEELAVAIMRLVRKCFGSQTGVFPDHVSKKFGVDIIAIVKGVKEFSQHHGIDMVTRACLAAITQLKIHKKDKLSGYADASDPFGKALEEQNEVSSCVAPGTNGDLTPHSSDSASYKAVGKAAAAMANGKTIPASDRSLHKTAISHKVGSITSRPAQAAPALGTMFASELGIQLPTSKPRPGVSAGGLAHARSMPKEKKGADEDRINELG
eukprot:CAMPEP_0178518104 /NCGR_PEP_ID=MMETSP0696-20121128/26066_1 /TAXON_ID=265572 /ORGANISM="Extubocellulus spinifer, Strain CCMP396" /LENGTH=982 /DNA_ID=CAMNT_0020148619 /DNA_START=52 /DNA_END=3000 /DNA_ORIENTATION=+